MSTAQGHHTNAFQVGDQGDQRDRALSAVEPNCWSHRGNGGKRPVFPFLFPQCTTSKMQEDPAVGEWNLAESCDPCKSLPVLTAAPAFQRAFRSASYPHTTGSRQFWHCLWETLHMVWHCSVCIATRCQSWCQPCVFQLPECQKSCTWDDSSWWTKNYTTVDPKQLVDSRSA